MGGQHGMRKGRDGGGKRRRRRNGSCSSRSFATHTRQQQQQRLHNGYGFAPRRTFLSPGFTDNLPLGDILFAVGPVWLWQSGGGGVGGVNFFGRPSLAVGRGCRRRPFRSVFPSRHSLPRCRSCSRSLWKTAGSDRFLPGCLEDGQNDKRANTSILCMNFESSF